MKQQRGCLPALGTSPSRGGGSSLLQLNYIETTSLFSRGEERTTYASSLKSTYSLREAVAAASS